MSPLQHPLVREPQQERSKQRREQILRAARIIILQKGCANLTISEIASVAGVTAGSMYQYYRNKADIVLALGQYYVELLQQRLGQVFTAPVLSRAELSGLFLQVLEQHYQLFLEDPVVRDIWAGTATDKDMQNLDQQDTAQHVQFFCAVAAPFFPVDAATELQRTLNLLVHFAIAGSRLALEQSPEEGQNTIKSAKQMLAAGWNEFCRRYPESQHPLAQTIPS